MKRKNLILIIIAAVAATVLLPLTAYASREGENMLYVEIYDLPVNSTVDILLKDKDIDAGQSFYQNHSCTQIHTYNEDGYTAYFAHTENEYVYSYYKDSPKGTYALLKYDFGHNPPMSYKVIVCTAKGEVYVSCLQWFKHGRRMQGYYTDGAFVMKRQIEYSADSLGGVILIMLLMQGLNTLRLLIVIAADIALAFVFKIKRYKAMLILDCAFVVCASVVSFLSFINQGESIIVPFIFAFIKGTLFIKLYRREYKLITIAVYSASTAALGYFLSFYLLTI